MIKNCRNFLVASLCLFTLMQGFGFTNSAEAAPVEPTPVQLAQPDGQPFEAQPFGDEWYNGYEHNRFTILQNEQDEWVYALALPDGSLTASTVAVGNGRTPPPTATAHLRDQLALAAVPLDSRRFAPDAWGGARGAQPVLVLLVDFTPSTSLGTTAVQWNSAFFNDSAGAKSVKNFYDEASFNQFTIEPIAESQGTNNDGIVMVTLDQAHPNTSGSTGTANKQLTADALTAADTFIDFSQYDLNSNGALDVTELHVLVIPRGYETAFGGAGAACSPNVWGHRWALQSWEAPTLDGVSVANGRQDGGYMQFGEWQDTTSGGCPGSTDGNMATIGIMAHELGHDINWPDLYDIDGSSSGIGYWSVMASGSWGRAAGEQVGTTPVLPDAFSKMYQGWITPTVVAGNAGSLTVPNSAENPTVYQLGENSSGIDWDFGTQSGVGEYFLVENRQQVGFDEGLYRINGNAQGLLIWHIDESVTASNYANATEARRLIDVVEAHSSQEMETSTNKGNLNDIWPGSNNYTAFGPNSMPNSNWHDGTESGIVVENISVLARGSISAEFNVPTVVPTSVALQNQSTQSALASLVALALILVVATVLSKRRS